jgi:hypothetical protein
MHIYASPTLLCDVAVSGCLSPTIDLIISSDRREYFRYFSSCSKSAYAEATFEYALAVSILISP